MKPAPSEQDANNIKIIDISNAPFARPDLNGVPKGLKSFRKISIRSEERWHDASSSFAAMGDIRCEYRLAHANPHSQRMSQRTTVIKKNTNAANAPMTTRVQNHMPQSCVPCAQA